MENQSKIEQMAIEGVIVTPQMIEVAKSNYQQFVATSANHMMFCSGTYKFIEMQIKEKGDFNIDSDGIMMLSTAFDTFKCTLAFVKILQKSQYRQEFTSEKVYKLEESLEHNIRKIDMIKKGDYRFE